jgi:uncharacterized protein
VVKAGDVVKVKVVEVDIPRKRIALTMRLDDPIGEAASPAGASAGAGQRRDERGPRRDNAPRSFGPKPGSAPAPSSNAFADAFAKAKRS